MATTPTTRARLADSKILWESLEYSVTEGLGELELMQATVTRETTECTRIINAPPADGDDPWAIVVLLENLRTSKDTFQKRIIKVEKHLDELFNEVAHGPAPTGIDEEDTYKTRQYKHKRFHDQLETIKRNFNEWKLRLQQIIQKHEVKYNPPEHPGDGDDGDDRDGDDDPTPRRGARDDRPRERGREPNNNMKDASALKPDTLDIQMSSLAINS